MSNLHLINEINRLGHWHQLVQPDHFLISWVKHGLFPPLHFFLVQWSLLPIVKNWDTEIEFFLNENFENFRQQSRIHEGTIEKFSSISLLIIRHLLSGRALLLIVILNPSLSGYKYFSLFFSLTPKQEKLSSPCDCVRLPLTKEARMAVNVMTRLRVLTDILSGQFDWSMWTSGYTDSLSTGQTQPLLLCPLSQQITGQQRSDEILVLQV